jgi:hypothetical protein
MMTTETIVVVISVLALFVAVWQVITSRVQNENSVRPLIGDITRTSPEGRALKISLVNKGNGPSLIKDQSITILGINNKDISDSEFWEGINAEIQKHIPVAPSLRVGYEPAGQTIGKNEETVILELRLDNSIPEDEALTLFEQVIKQTKIEISYQSLYGKEYTYSFNQQLFSN